MTWLAWRQHRLGLAGFAVLFLAVVALYRLAAPLGADALTVYTAAAGFSRLVKLGEDVSTYLQPLPVLVGMFAGAPLVSREIEHGTYRYAWTQGTSRGNWLRSKVLLVGGAVLVLSALVSAVHMAWFAPAAPDRGWFQLFNQSILVFPATCLFTFALGVAIGALIRRTVPAMATTLVAAGAVFLLFATVLRPNYQAPLTVSSPVTAIDGPPELDGAYYLGSVVNGEMTTTSYHPADRFWTFQFVEAGIYLALTAALLALTFWWLRRKFS
ncbi:ABC transporter permease subunit [Saccharopolyspora hirsuta]|uniref:ABC transporter permease subunit n=1 Tax=Saccharopolyspora hirsuta TaxID=1837 RepID=A0A5M7BJC9_SACHI|nr:ABC transporter permease subunit [Saccharopolyspora hirsuta]KAA5829073.1 ABC transporter permease subunit [Saccharopolyspora hirsuta]